MVNSISRIFIVAALLAAPHVTFASDGSIAQMARVVIDLQHFPSDAAKASLSAIANDKTNSDTIRQIAIAIANIQHKVMPADREKLAAIVASDAADDDARALAKVLNGINHVPSQADVAILKKLAGE